MTSVTNTAKFRNCKKFFESFIPGSVKNINFSLFLLPFQMRVSLRGPPQQHRPPSRYQPTDAASATPDQADLQQLQQLQDLPYLTTVARPARISLTIQSTTNRMSSSFSDISSSSEASSITRATVMPVCHMKCDLIGEQQQQQEVIAKEKRLNHQKRLLVTAV